MNLPFLTSYQNHGFDQLPVVNSENGVLGMITEGNLISHLRGGRVRGSAPISEVLCMQLLYYL